jgi:putative tricarboxylic transport membrane protein
MRLNHVALIQAVGLLGRAVILMGIAAAAATPAMGQDKYPARSVTLIVGFGPGSPSDSTARLIAESFHSTTGQPFVVENRPGAGGTRGANSIAKAAPDGYALLVTTSSTQSAAPALFKSLTYDPIKDFTPIARISGLPQVIVSNNSYPFKTMGELVAYAKANPGKLSYASSNATATIAGETLKRRHGLDMARVPYQSNTVAMTDLIAGHVPLMVSDFGTALGHINAKKITPLAVLTRERSQLLPDVPTLHETVLPGFDLVGWGGLFGPPGLPPDVVKLLSDGVGKALAREDIAERFRAAGMEVFYMPSSHFAGYVAAQLPVWLNAAKEAGVEPQ